MALISKDSRFAGKAGARGFLSFPCEQGIRMLQSLPLYNNTVFSSKLLNVKELPQAKIYILHFSI